MKYTWEEKDIICGRIVCKDPSYQGNSTFDPNGSALKWTMKLGYGFYPDGQNFCMLSLTDGLIYKLGRTAKEVADYLNKCELIPMPHEWFMQAMNELRDVYGKQ